MTYTVTKWKPPPNNDSDNNSKDRDNTDGEYLVQLYGVGSKATGLGNIININTNYNTIIVLAILSIV